MILRLLCFCCLCSLLNSCLYYGDIQSHSKPNSIFTSKEHYDTPHFTETTWWEGFDDPQLNQLISIALQDSPTIQMAENRIRSAKNLAASIGTSLWPSIDLSGFLEREQFAKFGLVPPPFNGKTFTIGELGLSTNYEFDFWGKNRAALAASLREENALEAERAEARLVLSAAVASNYIQLLNTIQQRKLAKENWKKSNEIKLIVFDRAKNGIESDVPLKSALSNEQLTRLSLEQFKEAERLARNQLAILLGKNPFTTDIMTQPFMYRDHHVKMPSFISANQLAKRPDVCAAKWRVEAAAESIHVAKARFFPNINLNLLFSYQSIQLSNLFTAQNQNKAITGAIDLPLFDAGLRRANLGIKYAEYDLAVNTYDQTILTALKEIADQETILNSLNAQLSAQNKAVKATADNYRLLQSRFKHGIVDYLQVLEIEQLLIQQQSTKVNLQARYMQATIGLLKALGGSEMTRENNHVNIPHRRNQD